MKTFKTIDLWTEQYNNDLDLFKGAFIDGFSGFAPYTYYRVILNCNCLINVNIKDVFVSNKHHAIVFYKYGLPSRVALLNKETDVLSCIDEVFKSSYDFGLLQDKYKEYQIYRNVYDFKQEPIFNKYEGLEQTSICSCNSQSLLDAMLSGSYTEDVTGIGDNISNYEYIQGSIITFKLFLEKSKFLIYHNNAYKSDNKIITIQRDSELGLSLKK